MVEKMISSKAIGLLKEWYFRTREANFKSCYPHIAVRWEKCGLAWQEVGVGFELSRCTSPRELRDWEEAGHQFCKLPELQQALIVGNRFHGWTVTELREACRMARVEIEGLIRCGLRKYEGMCLDVGLIEEDDTLQRYLSGNKQIGRYLGGVSEKTVRRLVLDAGLPVIRVGDGSVMASKDDLDEWFMEQRGRVAVRRILRCEA
jgi:hypothetical protein